MPITRDLQETVQNIEIKKILQEKREEILKIAARYGASNVRIFGSVARGEATADSDKLVNIKLVG